MTTDTPRSYDGSPVPPLEQCHHCDAYVPVGEFCGHCGAHLADTHAGARTRIHAYSAAPHEHVGQPALISTLFPHLPRRAAHTFRIAFAIGIALIVALSVGRLYTSATVAACVLLPVLYLLYLYEVEVYEDQPISVILLTFVAGAAFGTGYALLVDHVSSLDLGGNSQPFWRQALVFPVLAEVLMLAGPLVLLALIRSRFDATLDGLAFGAASALGFSMAVAVTGNWHLFTAPVLGDAPSGDEFLRLFRTGILAAIVNATSVGIITAAIWLEVHNRSRRRHVAPWRGLVAGAVVAFGVQVALAVASRYVADLWLSVAIWAAAAVALLIYLRIVLHHALLEEGAEHAVGEPGVCTECHRLVPTMLFCPSCGAARSAAPKGTRERRAAAARAARPAGEPPSGGPTPEPQRGPA